MDLESLFKARGIDAQNTKPEAEIKPVQDVYDPIASLRAYARDIAKEDELGTALIKKQLISEKQEREAYASLEENSRNTMVPIPLSIVFELNSMEHINMDRILNYLAMNHKIPFLSIRNFKIKPELIAMLPPDVGEKLGIALFGALENSVQVACLNPIRKDELEEMLKECLKRTDIYFYLTRPEEITLFYDRLRKQLTEL